MRRKFAAAQSPDPLGPEWDEFIEQYYFFYGTLMDPSTLSEVLLLPGWPELRPAKIVEYHCKLWIRFSALLESGDEVHGMAYWVKSKTELARLIEYEGDVYTHKRCVIHFKDDGSQALRSTCVWCGDEALLREGEFDLKDWQMMRFQEGPNR
jgi:AIG2-like family.